MPLCVRISRDLGWKIPLAALLKFWKIFSLISNIPIEDKIEDISIDDNVQFNGMGTTFIEQIGYSQKQLMV